ncbi:cupin domain-containing protein [Cytobacillus sp. IB215316]|uniref:cupin domain-containing protein n=1 Tax=Cytobacillus sp. IB215316 TaxID=3097354 RepID=UPI002A0FF770|nr:cupin domain-containing protein [Cytobacillus sp. IB215316]MDX8360541.1 cupin domain-containing protein [Cytobacillus sp. IB215316]
MEIKNISDFTNDNKVLKKMVYRTDYSTTVLVKLAPGGEVAEHNHPKHDIFVQVVEGEVKFVVNGEEHELSKDHLLRLEGHEKVSLQNNSEADATVYIILSKQ